jgi:hypothetical protein
MLWLVVGTYVLAWPAATTVASVFPEVFRQATVRIAVLAAGFGSISLLGIWAGFTDIGIWKRILAVVPGIVCLVMAVDMLATDQPRYLATRIEPTLLLPGRDAMEGTFLVLFSLQLLGIAGSLLLIRRFGTKLRFLGTELRRQGNQRLQYSLRSLMGITLAVSVLFSAISSYRVYRSCIVFGVVVAIAETALALATVWAALGRGRPFLRIVPVVVFAVGLGLTAAIAQDWSYGGWLWCSILQVALIFGPLVVVRSMGYRLTRD